MTATSLRAALLALQPVRSSVVVALLVGIRTGIIVLVGSRLLLLLALLVLLLGLLLLLGLFTRLLAAFGFLTLELRQSCLGLLEVLALLRQSLVVLLECRLSRLLLTSHDCTQRLTPRQLAIVRLLEVRLELGAVRGNHLLPRAAHVRNLGVERAARFAHSRRQCFEQGRDLGSALLHEVCNPGRCLGADALEQARLRGDLLSGTAQLAASRLDLRHGIVERLRNLAHRILPQLACLVSNRLRRLLTRLGLVAFALLDRRQAVELIRQELGAKSGDALLLLELRTLFGQHANLVVGDELVAQGGPFAVCRMRGRTLEFVVDELLSLVQE